MYWIKGNKVGSVSPERKSGKIIRDEEFPSGNASAGFLELEIRHTAYAQIDRDM